MKEYDNEVGIDQPLFENLDPSAEIDEIGLGDCPHGCKIYANPRTGYSVLGHNPNYGCKVTKSDLEKKE